MCLLINVLMIDCNLNLSLWLIPDYAVMLLHHDKVFVFLESCSEITPSNATFQESFTRPFASG